MILLSVLAVYAVSALVVFVWVRTTAHGQCRVFMGLTAQGMKPEDMPPLWFAAMFCGLLWPLLAIEDLLNANK